MPVHPVSCEEANKILDLLNGPEAPESWKNNVTDSLKIGGRSDGIYYNIRISLILKIGSSVNVFDH